MAGYLRRRGQRVERESWALRNRGMLCDQRVMEISFDMSATENKITKSDAS